MTYRLRLFASLKERLGQDQIELDLPAPVHARDLKPAIALAYPALESLLAGTRIAVDHAFVSADHPLSPDAEIALIPPVSGG